MLLESKDKTRSQPHDRAQDLEKIVELIRDTFGKALTPSLEEALLSGCS